MTYFLRRLVLKELNYSITLGVKLLSYNEKKKQVLCVVMKLYFLSKFKNTMSAKDRPGCPEGGMVQRSGTATCLIVRDLSTSVVLPVVLNLYLRLLGRTAPILYL